eukprot:CAMPEP_0118647698 /NCGR_PEP_ID=MMETSP0785-20121206/8750_1 /TAXON_ID=91992 /ORGANISM="Bolidomonas pacifica, Strain CCMP 1866" /LENGTH=1655 /DNA_ID=CAMNT_0006539819 /DNA_START=92 /DNA_END=5055 /DNA_ORIENTATION=-
MSQFSDASEAERSSDIESNPMRTTVSSRHTMEVDRNTTPSEPNSKNSESSSHQRCCSCCSCLISPLYHEKKRVRYPARIFFLLAIVYFCYSCYVVSDLLKLLKCEKASCNDWCIRMDTGRIKSLSREDNHLDFETEAVFRYPAKTQVGMGTSELKLNYGGKTMMVMTSSVPSFTHEDGTISNKLMHGTSRMYVNASGELGNLDLGASLFGKLMAEKAIELEIEVKATVTTWAFSFFPITLTMPTRKEAYTCRQVNASTICDVGTLDQFNEISCVTPNEYPISDPTIHSINFVPSPSPNSLKLWSNFTVDHGSSLQLYAQFPDISVAVYTTDSYNPYSENDRLTDAYTPIAIVNVVGARMHGKYVTGVVDVDVVGTDDRIKELQDVVDILLDGSDTPEVLLYIQGIADSGNESFLQRMLALMPTIKMLDYDNVNINTVAKDFNLSDAVQLKAMSLTSVDEDRDSHLETGLHASMFLNIPFNCYGAVAPVLMDVLDPDDASNVLLRGGFQQTVLYGQDNPAQADITVSLIDPGRLLTLAGDGRLTELKLTGTPTSPLLLSQILSQQELDLEPVIAGMLRGKNASIDLNSFDVNASLYFEEAASTSTFYSYFNANISNVPVTFDIEVGALNLTITSNYPPSESTSQPVFSLITSKTNCPKGSFCAVQAEMAIMTSPTRDMLTAYTSQDEVKVTGFGTIAATPNISLPVFTLPTFPTLSSVQNLTKILDSQCETKSGLCLFNGAVNVETVNILGETIAGGNIDVPCVFGEGLCPLYTPAEIQQLPPTSAAMAINITVDVAEYVPFLKNFEVAFPEIVLGVDMGDKADSLSLRVPPVTITDKLSFTQMIYAAGSVNDWTAVFRTLNTFSDQGANITTHGSPTASPGSLSSAIPDITLQIPNDSNDFNFVFPDLPLPYSEANNSAPQWILTETTTTSAKFQIEFSFQNPVPIALTVDNVHISLLYNDGTTDVEIAKVQLPENKFELQNGNNTVLSFLTLQGDAGVESCKADCYELNSEADRIACIPCAATLFLKDFLARNPTSITVVVMFDNIYGDTITTTIPLTMYDNSEENKMKQARDKNFIDEVVDIESLLSRALYFELDFSSTIYNILTNILGTALGNIPGELDVTIDNIFSFSFSTEKMFVQKVDFSDIDGVPKTMPLANLPWPYDVCSKGLNDCPIELQSTGVRDVESTQLVHIASGVTSDAIAVPITGSFEALARAIHELYVSGRFCLHLSDGLVDMVLNCDDAANPPGVPCDSSGGDFGLTMAWAMNDVPLYRKNACHLRKDCIIMGSRSVFSYLGDQNLFQPSDFTTSGSGSVEVKTNEISLNDGGSGFGSVFRNSKVNLFDSWVATFKFKYSCRGSCDDKGGFSFVMQNQAADAIGDPNDCSVTMKTEGIRNIPPILDNGFVDIGGTTKMNCGGYKGIDNSVAVVFSNERSQMYYFLGGLLYSDDYRQAVAGWKNGGFKLPKIGEDEVGSSVREGSDLLSYIQIPNEEDLNDETEHSVKIVYNNVWRMLYVYLDGEDVLLEIPVDMEEMNLDDGMGFVGFTTNNAASNDNDLTITEFTFSQGKVSPADSNVHEEGQERSSPGKPGVFRVDSRDSCGMPRRVGGEDYDIKLINRDDTSLVVECDLVEDKNDGFYACWYVADNAGTYDVQYGG